MTAFRLILAGLGLPVLMSACLNNEAAAPPPGGTLDGMTINNNEGELSDRVTDKDEEVELDSAAGGSPKRAAGAKTLALTLVSEITPPVIDGDTLQATSVVLKNGFAYVSYNYQGDKYLGGVDIVQINSGKKPELLSQVLFNDVDVHSLHFDGALYLAGATSDPAFDSPAILERVQVKGGKMVLQKRERVPLNSFASTAVTVNDKQVYAVSGNTGSLHVLKEESLTGQPVDDLEDARWVDYDKTNIVVVQGVPGRVSVYDNSTLALSGTWAFKGADVAEAKTTVRVLGGKALIAAGSGGVQLMSLATGKIVGSIPVPQVQGVTAAQSVANAADAESDLIYVSNAEAGVYAVQASEDLAKTSGESDIALTVLGKLIFSGYNSTNHVAFDGNTLVVAAGLGGVKIISVKWE